MGEITREQVELAIGKPREIDYRELGDDWYSTAPDYVRKAHDDGDWDDQHAALERWLATFPTPTTGEPKFKVGDVVRTPSGLTFTVSAREQLVKQLSGLRKWFYDQGDGQFLWCEWQLTLITPAPDPVRDEARRLWELARNASAGDVLEATGYDDRGMSVLRPLVGDELVCAYRRAENGEANYGEARDAIVAKLAELAGVEPKPELTGESLRKRREALDMDTLTAARAVAAVWTEEQCAEWLTSVGACRSDVAAEVAKRQFNPPPVTVMQAPAILYTPEGIPYSTDPAIMAALDLRHRIGYAEGAEHVAMVLGEGFMGDQHELDPEQEDGYQHAASDAHEVARGVRARVTKS
jgi:hypothetical protein